jgi:putative spermidine/putrescine transport system substrate-binding protein
LFYSKSRERLSDGAEFKGKAALNDSPTTGVIDVALAVEAHGAVKYRNKGNMARDEIDKTINLMIEIKKSGHFRSFWTTFDQSLNLMASGEVVIQSMISPAVTAVRTRGIPCVFQPLREGYRHARARLKKLSRAPPTRCITRWS